MDLRIHLNLIGWKFAVGKSKIETLGESND